MKEFVAASSDEKKAVFSKIEQGVEVLEGSAARYSCQLDYSYQRVYVHHKTQCYAYILENHYFSPNSHL